VSRAAKTSASDGTAASTAGCTVTVCCGCCCGQTEKNPRTSHAAQLARLHEALPPGARLRQSDCLDVCQRSNVVVIGPSAAGRAAGARPTWLGQVNDQDAIEDVTAWITAGGTGIAPAPLTLGRCEFTPSRRNRARVEGCR
jgi:(2Fe-2S) ferredoxin